MGWKLPEYIGHPGYQNSPEGVPSMLFEKTLLDTLQVAYIRPLKPKMEANINLYRGEDAWGEYVEYLGANNIDPPKEKQLKVVISQIQPLTESYTNEFGPSELASGIQSISSGGLQEMAFMTGYNGKQSLEEMEKKGGLGGKLAGAYKGATDAAGNLVGDLTNSQLGKDVSEALQNPTAKIDIPNMWKGSSFTSSYQITVRLYCFSPDSDQHFTELILAPLGALMMFVAPKSDRGKFYTWPFMMEFTIPGQAYIPLGYCQSLDVVKGGDVSDISWIKRPGTVDLRMTINTVFGVRTNAKGSGDAGQRPTILQELQLMAGMVPTKAKLSNAGGGSPGESLSQVESGFDSTLTQPWSGYNRTPEQAGPESDAAADALATAG